MSGKKREDIYVIPIKVLLGLSISAPTGMDGDDLQKHINAKVEKELEKFIPSEELKKHMYEFSMSASKLMDGGSAIMIPGIYRGISNEEDSNIVADFMRTLNDNIVAAEKEKEKEKVKTKE